MKYYKLSLHDELWHSIPYIAYLTSDRKISLASSTGLGEFGKLSSTLEQVTKEEFEKAMPEFKGKGVGTSSSS
jgi:hypothetical protein